MGAGYTSIVLGNHPVSVNLQRIFLLRLREGVTKQKLKKISQVGFVRLVAIRLEAPGLNVLLLTTAFNKVSTAMIAFGLKECLHYLMHG